MTDVDGVPTIEPIRAALQLRNDQTDDQARLRQPGSACATEESERYALRQSLQRYPIWRPYCAEPGGFRR